MFSVVVWNQAPWNVVVPVDSVTAKRDINRIVMPERAAEYLRSTGFRGNVMTFFHHGGYLSWRLYPAVRVSCDARYEVAFPPSHIDANFHAYLVDPGAFRDEVARLPGTDLILIDRKLPSVAAARCLAGWRSVYEDDLFVLLGRDTNNGAEALASGRNGTYPEARSILAPVSSGKATALLPAETDIYNKVSREG